MSRRCCIGTILGLIRRQSTASDKGTPVPIGQEQLQAVVFSSKGLWMNEIIRLLGENDRSSLDQCF